LKAGDHQPEPARPSDPHLDGVATKLRNVLSADDVKHVIEAVNANAEFFLTADSGVLKHDRLAAEMGIRILSPNRLETELRTLHILPP
jgi:hypothetical protein